MTHAPLSHDEYERMLRGTKAPTSEQAQEFADYVAESHSWYKHLPQVPPGTPFVFFLNPFAGYDLFVDGDGRFRHRERVGNRGFHYSWLPTAEYHRRFGHIDYRCDAGTTMYLPATGEVIHPRSACPVVLDAQGHQRPIPADIAALGTVEVTGMVHPRSAWIGLYKRFPHLQSEVWPDRIGGQALRARVMQRIAAVLSDPGLLEEVPDQLFSPDIDGQLLRLLEPERKRQRAAMAQAIERVGQRICRRSS